ncbi:MAG: tetratricopeptide repeat protein [Candidatus Methanoperedens sp.]
MGIGLGAKLVLEKNYQDAEEVFGKILEFFPYDVEVMTLLANLYFIEGDLNKSEEWLEKVFIIDPNYPQALYEMGTVYHERDEWEKAISMFEKAIEIFPKDAKKEIADVYQNLGCSLWEIRRRTEAIEAWKTCLKYNPRQKYAKQNLKDFVNEYGMPKSPVGMDDYWAFVDIKRKEYLSVKGGDYFKGIDEANVVLNKITGAWDNKIIPKYGSRMNHLKTKDKVKLFEDTKVLF